MKNKGHVHVSIFKIQMQRSPDKNLSLKQLLATELAKGPDPRACSAVPQSAI